MRSTNSWLTLCWLLWLQASSSSFGFSGPAVPGSSAGVVASSRQPALFSSQSRSHRLSRSSSASSSSTSTSDIDVAEGEEIVHISAVEGRVVKLTAALSTFNSTDAADLLQELQTVRQETTTTSGGDPAVQTILQELLENGPDRALPLWSRLRPLARFSQRARLASLRRVLDLTTPPPSSDDDAGDSEESRQRRRRRALLSVLRTLSRPASESGFADDNQSSSEKNAPPAIRQLERQAARERRGRNLGDLLSRRPEGLETPKYTVLTATNANNKQGYEIRRYEPYSVATVAMEQLQLRDADPTRYDAQVNEPAKGGVKAFGALAGYLFGKNQQETAMKMTTPVFSTTTATATTTDDSNKEKPSSKSSGTTKSMSFVLPSTYWNETATAPQPLPGSGVQLQRVEPEERAVLLFGGYVTGNAAKQRRQLLAQLRQDPDWQVDDDNNEVQLAQYNDPFTPPWKRLNEVSVRVVRRSDSKATNNKD